MVIGVTDEALSVVDPWVERVEPTYPIAVLSTDALERALEVKGFPTVGVVGPGGELLYKGFKRPSLQDALDEALAAAEPGELFPRKELSKAFELVREGEESKAYSETLKQLERAEGELATWLTRYRTYFEERALHAQERAKELVAEGLVLRAVEHLEPYAEAKPPFPSTEASATWLASLEDSIPTYKQELKAGAQFEKAAEKEDEGEFEDAAKAYVKIYKKYDDTLLAEVARKRATELVQAGLPGYRSSCPSCKEGRRACSKHEAEVKL